MTWSLGCAEDDGRAGTLFSNVRGVGGEKYEGGGPCERRVWGLQKCEAEGLAKPCRNGVDGCPEEND